MNTDFASRLLSNTKALVAAAVAVVLVIGAIWFFATYNSTQKNMVKREQALSSQYKDNQNELAAYVSTIKEALGVADRNTDALDKVLANAVQGRYQVGSTAQPGGGELFSAITEAYPDLSGVSLPYQKVQDAVISGREAFKNKQTKMLDMAREYETWKNSGIIHSRIASMVGAPSDNLVAAIGDDVKKGQAALDRMKTIVVTAESSKSFESGEMDPLDLGPTAAPSAK
ncbi:hypothetical protein [Aeromicrobium sp. 179-A 4D2 NHS]|uniref:hypothetical protein n=1 Tax=Aeromicrobium sp. 179-A 4D2 NHS TaxID=3142375 RepID=UPI00399EF26F